jgi:hypothetical protein
MPINEACAVMSRLGLSPWLKRWGLRAAGFQRQSSGFYVSRLSVVLVDIARRLEEMYAKNKSDRIVKLADNINIKNRRLL